MPYGTNNPMYAYIMDLLTHQELAIADTPRCYVKGAYDGNTWVSQAVEKMLQSYRPK